MDYCIPKQTEGGESETIVSRDFAYEDEAAQHYQKVKTKLFDINNWYNENGQKKSKFYLCDATGQVIQSKPTKGNLIRIDVSGPENAAGDGDDWVLITHLDEEKHLNEACSIIEVKPCKAPTNGDDEVAHFYEDCASNSFILKQVGNCVSLEIYGRNESLQKDGVHIFNKIRNFVMGLGGLLGGSKSQWDVLANNLMNDESFD